MIQLFPKLLIIEIKIIIYRLESFSFDHKPIITI